MKTFTLMLLSVLLTGCITIAMPPQSQQSSPPQQVPAERVVRVCQPYQPPTRQKVPANPAIPETRGTNYTKYLEDLSESLARKVGQLREYIDNEHTVEDEAQRRHLQSCNQEQ
jgi:hypothetical protein